MVRLLFARGCSKDDARRRVVPFDRLRTSLAGELRMPYKKIVVATDGSETAEHAQRVAAALAKSSRAQLVLVHGCHRAEDGEAVIARAKEALAAEGVTPGTEVHEGDPVEIVTELADRLDAGLIVIGTRGLSRAKRFFLGSVSHSVAYHAPCDVLLVRARPKTLSAPDPSYHSVVVATDGSPTADRAARKGLDLARKVGASATLVYVGHPSTGEIVLKDTLEGMGEGMDAKLRIVGGDPAEKIIEVAEAERADLVVVGNKGMTGATRFLLGSIPQKVLEHAQCDVLIARTITQLQTEIEKGEGGIVSVDGRKVAVYRNDDGVLIALSAKCTHMGCTVGWNASEKTWDCPCHGSRYHATGEVLNGPAAKALAPTEL
jgi:nucleotide-binding universal stress UspA family protein/nitrite reductase/ring-hydroxylating ferredoxin subunit